MRIVRSESTSLSPLDPLLPSLEGSWALQVEREEAAHLHSKDNLVHRDHNRICKDNGKERIWGSSKWADCSRSLDRKSTYAVERCDDSRRQSRSSRQNTRRPAPPHRSYCALGNSRSLDFFEAEGQNEKKSIPARSHSRQTQADFHETALYAGTKILETVDRSCHTSSRLSDNVHCRQSHRARHGGSQATRFSENADNARHGRTQDAQLSENRDNARHGDLRRTRDAKLAESADNARDEHAIKPSEPADNERHRWHDDKVGRSSGHKTFRRSKGNVGNKVENESNQGAAKLRLEARSQFDEQKQRKYEECKEFNGVSAMSDHKCRDYKKQGNGDRCIDARNATCQETFSQSEINTRFSSESFKEVGALLMQQGLNEGTGGEESDTTSLHAGEGTGSTSTEGRRKGSSGSKSVLEMSSKDDVEAEEDDPLDTQKQYQMLASLLLDDSLDIDQDFDVMLAPGGPDLEFCGSIFGDDFELPVSMDVEAAANVKSAMSAKKEEAVCPSQPVDLQDPHLCVMRGLFQDGKDQSMSCNKLAKRHAGFQPAEMQQSLQDSSKTKSSTRVFVDVTNKFEIHAAPVKRETQENDIHRLNQRQRQVDFGKNTLGYERYSELVPRCKRKPQDPQTPNPKQVCSKRSWDGQIRKWRRLLHAYDLPNEDGEERAEDFSVLKPRQGHAVDSMRDNTRFSKSIENKGCNAGKVKMMEEDANLTIYDDWMVS